MLIGQQLQLVILNCILAHRLLLLCDLSREKGGTKGSKPVQSTIPPYTKYTDTN